MTIFVVRRTGPHTFHHLAASEGQNALSIVACFFFTTQSTGTTATIRTTFFVITIGLTGLLADSSVIAGRTRRAGSTGTAAAIRTALLVEALGLATATTATLPRLFDAQSIPHRITAERVHFANTHHDVRIIAAREVMFVTARAKTVAVLGTGVAVLPKLRLADPIPTLIGSTRFALSGRSALRSGGAGAAVAAAAIGTTLLVYTLGTANTEAVGIADITESTRAATSPAPVIAALLTLALRLT